MKLDFKIVPRPGKYHKAVDAVSNLPQKPTKGKDKNSDVEDSIQTYCIVGQVSEPNDALKINEKVVELLPTTKKRRDEQAKNKLFQNLGQILKRAGTITADKDGLLCRKALIDGAVKIVVPQCYKRTILYQGHCPTLFGHTRTRGTCDVLRKTYYWPHMASNVHEFVIRCKFCRRCRPSQTQHR